jgi:flagellar biosynthesis/type III secretory pathway chaperone
VSTRQTQAAITNAGEAERAIASLNNIMDRLVETVEQETARARAGKLRDVTELDDAKLELARHYFAETERVRAAKNIVAQSQPDALERLRTRHDAFQKVLQTNLTVLATAHAVAEGIIRGVSSELARKHAPSTYGASGRANVPSSKTSQPMSVCRSL